MFTRCIYVVSLKEALAGESRERGVHRGSIKMAYKLAA